MEEKPPATLILCKKKTVPTLFFHFRTSNRRFTWTSRPCFLLCSLLLLLRLCTPHGPTLLIVRWPKRARTVSNLLFSGWIMFRIPGIGRVEPWAACTFWGLLVSSVACMIAATFPIWKESATWITIGTIVLAFVVLCVFLIPSPYEQQKDAALRTIAGLPPQK